MVRIGVRYFGSWGDVQWELGRCVVGDGVKCSGRWGDVWWEIW